MAYADGDLQGVRPSHTGMAWNLGRRPRSNHGVKARLALASLAILVNHADVYALNPPSDSDGPIRLLSCVVSASGILEAEVDSQSDDALSCNLSCSYDIGGKLLSHWFVVTIPKRFSGRVGHFDTNGGRAGNFSGDVGTCEKTDAHALHAP
jgi:hypothetical protein